MITHDILERILQEREERYKAELQRQKAEMKLEAMESRLQAIEKRLEEDEKEPPEQSIGGFKLTDIVQAYTMYQQINGDKK